MIARLSKVATMSNLPAISGTVTQTQMWITLLRSLMATSPALTIRLLPESIIYMVGRSKTKAGLSMEILIEIPSWPFSAILMTKPARRQGSGRKLTLGSVSPARKVRPSHKSGLTDLIARVHLIHSCRGLVYSRAILDSISFTGLVDYLLITRLAV